MERPAAHPLEQPPAHVAGQVQPGAGVALVGLRGLLAHRPPGLHPLDDPSGLRSLRRLLDEGEQPRLRSSVPLAIVVPPLFALCPASLSLCQAVPWGGRGPSLSLWSAGPAGGCVPFLRKRPHPPTGHIIAPVSTGRDNVIQGRREENSVSPHPHLPTPPVRPSHPEGGRPGGVDKCCRRLVGRPRRSHRLLRRWLTRPACAPCESARAVRESRHDR